MGWLDAMALDPLEPLADKDEAELLALFDDFPSRSPELSLLGVDRYGCDLRRLETRNRFTFDNPKVGMEGLKAALIDCIERHR
jgi:hypothetical protein